MPANLWPRPRWLTNFEPPLMKIDEDVRKCVCFLGHADPPGDTHAFEAKATGFFLVYDGVRYIITSRHVATAFGEDPFQIRVNAKNGGAGLINFDGVSDDLDKWHVHPDENVDLAAITFPYDLQGGGMDHAAINRHVFETDEQLAELGIGIGDRCYAVGLFRLLQGAERNFPVVHSGTIAALPSDELIPMRDEFGTLRNVRGYLVEMANLRGLSGAPVLVRSTIQAIVTRAKVVREDGVAVRIDRGGQAVVGTPNQDVKLLGVWAGSWDAPPTAAIALDRGKQIRVPVGLGTVIPAGRLRELLELPHLVEQRKKLFEEYGPSEAVTD